MNFSPKLGSFQKNEGQIRYQWRQIYSSEHIHREYNNFFQGGMLIGRFIHTMGADKTKGDGTV